MLSDVIRKKRKELGLTLLDIAKYVGVTEATVQRWESGNIKNVRYEKVALLSQLLHSSPAEIMGWDEMDVSVSETFPNWTPGETIEDAKSIIPEGNLSRAVKIPVLGYVRAGIPIDAVEEILDYEEITEDMANTGAYFCLQIKGDSMEPKFSEGDVVVIRQQETVENGDIAVVLINGNDATIKKFYRTDAGIQLVATNPSYDPLFYTPKDVDSLPVSVIGKVVELRAKF